MPVTAPPTPPGAAPVVPSSTTPEAAFDAQLEAWHSYMRDSLQPYATAVASNVAANADIAEADALAAEAASAAAVGAANYKGAWSSLTGALAIPASVSHSGKPWLLVSSVADVTAHTPGVSAQWVALVADLPTPACKFDFVADGAITAGKAVILKSNGKVVQSAIAVGAASSPTTFESAITNYTSTCYDATADKFVVFYQDAGNSNHGTAVVGTLSGATVSFGTPVVFNAAATSFIASCYDPVAQKIIVAYSNASGNAACRVITVSGTTITAGAEVSTGQAASELDVCYDKSVSRVLFAYRSTSGSVQAVLGTVSGTSITFGSPTAVVGSGHNGYTTSLVHCDGAATNALCYNPGSRANIVSLTVNPTTYAITTGTALPVGEGAGLGGYAYGGRVLAWVSEVSRLAVLFEAGPSAANQLWCSLYSFSAGTWTRTASGGVDSSGSFSAPYQGFTSIAYNPSNHSLCAVYPDAGSTYYGKLRCSATLTATSVSFDSEIQFETSTTEYTSLDSNLSGGRFLVSYKDDGQDDFGKSIVATSPITDARTSFIGFADNTVSAGQTVTVATSMSVNALQTGLTPNTNYFLSSSDGSTLTTTVAGPRVGKALSATSLLVLGSNVYQV